MTQPDDSPGHAGADPRHDPELVENGDTRNVVDKYRLWTVEAIKADLKETQKNLGIAEDNISIKSTRTSKSEGDCHK